MARSWTADDPKAALMARKREALVRAATDAFLAAGYAGASVNAIAAAAGVSIKTLYRHFDDKADLFSGVIQAACGAPIDPNQARPDPAWYAVAPKTGLTEAGVEHLSHLLSPQQLDLYRVVVRDAPMFPDVGARYSAAVIGLRDAVFAGYLDRWAEHEGWLVRSPRTAAQSFAGLLKSDVVDDALITGVTPSADNIRERARTAASQMLILLGAGVF